MNVKRKKLITAISISLALVIVVSVFALPSTLWQNRIDKFRNICVHEAYAMITHKLNQTYMVILDVRSQAEFDTGHIANAINIPHDQLEDNLADPAHCSLAGHENDLILVYCKYGGRSSIASEILLQTRPQGQVQQFKNVYNMIGGTTQWANPVWNYTLVVSPPATYVDIGVNDAYDMITGGSATYGRCSLIVDVRTLAEYDAEHIVNSTIDSILHAKSIPYDNDAGFGSRIAPLIGHEYEPIIVYCQDEVCSKSVSACQYLVDHGFRKVYRLVGGLSAWKSAGKPTLPTPPSPSLFSDGFESGSFSAWTGTSVTSGNTLAVSSAPSHHPTYSCHALCAGGTGAYPFKTLSSAYDTLCVRMYVRFAVDLVNNANGIIIMKMANSANSGILNLRIRKTSGSYVLDVGNYAEGIYYTSTAFSIGVNTWYCVELQGHIGTSTGWFKALWNGNTIIDQSNQNTGTTQIQRVNVGVEYCWSSNPCDIYVDCVVVSNSPIGCE